MSIWHTDIKAAPHGRYVVRQHKPGVDTRVFVPERVILATKCGKVTISHYIPDEKRWMMLAKGEQPVAWQLWPEHPHSLRTVQPSAADTPEANLLPASGEPIQAEAVPA